MAMRVLWLSHFLPWPLRGGANIRSYHLSRELSRMSEVSFLTLNQRELLPDRESIEAAKQALGAHCSRVSALDIPMERLPLARERVVARSLLGGSYDEIWLRSRQMARALSKELEAFQPRVVHFDTIGLAQYAQWVRGIPVVLNHHNVESHMMRRRAEAARNPAMRALFALQARRLEAAERAAGERFDLHLTASELDRDRLLTIHPAITAEVIPSGVDIDYFQARRDESEVVPRSMIFVGGLNWYPNRSAIEWLLREVVPRIALECPEFRLTVVGRSPTPELLRTARNRPEIFATGEVEDIRPLVRRSAVYVCPIHEGGGTRLKVLDTMAQGVPMVATTMSVEGIPVQPGSHVLLADSPAEFSEAILRLFHDPELGRRLARSARELVEREFGWQAIGDRLRVAYQRIQLAKSPVPCAES